MMSDTVGKIVRSSTGRDRDQFLLCVGEDKSFLLLCDGKGRPLERPKRKNPRHVFITDDRLPQEDAQTNRALRRSLARYAQDNGRDA